MTEPPIGKDHCRVIVAEDFEYGRHLFAYTEAARRIAPDARVLEVGCGAGYGAAFLERSHPDLVATDFSADAVAYARAKYPTLRFEQASAVSLPFGDAAFDAIISFQVIEHIDDDAGYARELFRVLRPGGTLHVTTPNRRLRLLPFQRPWNPYHVREYDARGLHAVLSRAFGDVTVSGIATTPALTARELRRGRRNALGALAEPILRRTPGFLRALLRRVKPARPSAPSSSSSDAGPSLADFHVTADPRRALDLLAVARKGTRIS